MSDDDRTLMEPLRRMWEALDPEPSGLAERMLFALELAYLDVDLLASLDGAWAGAELTTVRSAAAPDEESVRTVTFGSPSLTVMVTLSGSDRNGHRVDGWIVPSGPLQVEVRTGRGPRRTVADETGRFVVDGLPSGLVQIVLHPTEGAHPRLTRPVVTPALRL